MIEPFQAQAVDTYFLVGSLYPSDPDGLNNYTLKVGQAARGRKQTNRPQLNEVGVTELVRVEKELVKRLDLLKEDDDERSS